MNKFIQTCDKFMITNEARFTIPKGHRDTQDKPSIDQMKNIDNTIDTIETTFFFLIRKEYFKKYIKAFSKENRDMFYNGCYMAYYEIPDEEYSYFNFCKTLIEVFNQLEKKFPGFQYDVKGTSSKGVIVITFSI